MDLKAGLGCFSTSLRSHFCCQGSGFGFIRPDTGKVNDKDASELP